MDCVVIRGKVTRLEMVNKICWRERERGREREREREIEREIERERERVDETDRHRKARRKRDY